MLAYKLFIKKDARVACNLVPLTYIVVVCSLYICFFAVFQSCKRIKRGVWHIDVCRIMPFRKAIFKNQPLPQSFVDSFSEEASCRRAYLLRPDEPNLNLKKLILKKLFAVDGTSLLGEASGDVKSRRAATSNEYLVNPRYGIWQVPSKAIFTALFHLTAGASACADLPRGTVAVGGAVTAALAVPVFDDAGTRIDFANFHLAGQEIGRHIFVSRFWHGKVIHSNILPARMLLLIGDFAGFGKKIIAMEVLKILNKHNLSLKDEEPDSEDDDESRYGNSKYGHDGNMSWWLSNSGYAPYARTDVDFYITAATLQEADERAEALKSEMTEILGDHASIRTPNTLTLCPAFPGRHVQIVLTVHKDLASVLLFADLDSTAVGFDGHDVWGTGRFLRAVRGGANVIPPNMWVKRRDTVARAAKYVKRGFGVCLHEHHTRDDALALEAIKKIHHIARMEKAYYRVTGDDADENTIVPENTGYNEYKIPRGPGVTPEIVTKFFAQHGPKRLTEAHDPLSCIWRLSFEPEEWMKWGVVE